jgi:hypothetical protein
VEIKVTQKEIVTIIQALLMSKALGSNQILNEILKILIEEILRETGIRDKHTTHSRYAIKKS